MDLEGIVELNYENKIRHCETMMAIWSARNLSPMGKNTILKSLILPKLNHLFSALPNPPDPIIDKFEKKCFKFIWGNKPDKVKRTQIVCDKENGGINCPKIRETICSQKVAMIRRAYISNSKWQYLFFKNTPLIKEFNVYEVMTKDHRREILNRISNPFYRDLVKCWWIYVDGINKDYLSDADMMSQPIWFHDNIKVGNKTVFNKKLYDESIHVVNDLIDDHGHFYTHKEFCRVYSINVNFLDYLGIIRSIQTYLQKHRSIQLKKLSYPLIPFHPAYLLKKSRL